MSMLLSTYFLYRSARDANLRDDMLKITFFVLGVSLLPVILPWSLVGIFFTFPFTFLSWPAIFGVNTYRVWENDFFHSGYSYSGGIPLAITFETTNRYEYLVIAFSLSLFVNILGALLGYWIGWISKEHRIEFLGSKWWKILWEIVGIVCVGLSLAPFFVPYLWKVISPPYLFGFGIILLETILFSGLIT
jgi:hypothetical protein